jgi:hypothetical protein
MHGESVLPANNPSFNVLINTFQSSRGATRRGDLLDSIDIVSGVIVGLPHFVRNDRDRDRMDA